MKFAVLTAAMLALFTSMAFSGGRSEEAGFEPGKRVRITGILRLVGNEPFTRFTVTDSEGKNYILEDLETPEGEPLIGREVTVEGVLQVRELKTADKKTTIAEHIITGTRLINP